MTQNPANHQLSLTTRTGGVEQVVYEFRALQESVTRLATALRGLDELTGPAGRFTVQQRAAFESLSGWMALFERIESAQPE